MSNKSYSITLKEVVSSIEISDADYERADRRYKALGEWFSSRQAKSAAHDPHISPQGSFRIGTVVRPIDQNEPYDLDMGCRLRKGVTKQSHTQKQLKTLVGDDLEAYRVENRITQQREEKNRCWRLRYKDQLEFHMDVVPSIPATTDKIQLLRHSLEDKVQSAVSISDLCASITDKTKPSYDQKSDDWLMSNAEGYALWFESRMSLAMLHMKRATEGLGGTIDDLPRWRWKTPLQRVVQLLKRHRDVMFAMDKDRQPISAIITTLAGLAYNGEEDIAAALDSVLWRMDSFVQPDFPRVANPANPQYEDFAEKWATPKGQELQLEENFRRWITGARAFFRSLGETDDAVELAKRANDHLSVTLNRATLVSQIGIMATGIATATPRKPADPQGGGRFG